MLGIVNVVPNSVQISPRTFAKWDDAPHVRCQGLKPLHRNVLWYRGGLVFEALVSLSLRLKDLLGPVTRVKKKERRLDPRAPRGGGTGAAPHSTTAPARRSESAVELSFFV